VRAVVNAVMNLRVSYKSEKVLRNCTDGGISRLTEPHEISDIVI
jgi:hypothetical protein